MIATRDIAKGEVIARDVPLLSVARQMEIIRERCGCCQRWLRDPLSPELADSLIDHLLSDAVFGEDLEQQLAPHGISLEKLRELLKKQVEEDRLARDDPTAAAAKPKKPRKELNEIQQKILASFSQTLAQSASPLPPLLQTGLMVSASVFSISHARMLLRCTGQSVRWRHLPMPARADAHRSAARPAHRLPALQRLACRHANGQYQLLVWRGKRTRTLAHLSLSFLSILHSSTVRRCVAMLHGSARTIASVSA